MPVCITGMHRSGTSMVARLLNLCGLYLGPESELIPASANNQEGFWEHRRLMKLNEEILDRLGLAWDLPFAAQPGWQAQPEVSALRGKALALVEELQFSSWWGWKDPRSSLTLPFWRELLPGLQVVVCLRHPLEVARSLYKRGASSRRFSCNLWLSYYRQVLSETAPGERIVTHYESYFHDPAQELRRVLDLLCMPASAETIGRACAAVAAPLRHHAVSVDEATQAGVPPEVLDVYAELCAEAGPVYKACVQAATSGSSSAGQGVTTAPQPAAAANEEQAETRLPLSPALPREAASPASLSLVILNERGSRLETWLSTLIPSDWPPDMLEVLVPVADEHASGADCVSSQSTQVRQVRVPPSLNQAQAANAAAAAATGEFLVYLDPELRLGLGWLSALLAALQAEPELACIGSALVDQSERDLILGVRPGDAFGLTSKPVEAPSKPLTYTLAASRVAALYRRDAFLEAGGFDAEAAFRYEDADLGWRLWLRGYRCALAPGVFASCAERPSPGTSSPHALAMAQRRALAAAIKYLEPDGLETCLPALFYVLLEQGLSMRAAHGALAVAVHELNSSLSPLLRTREKVQTTRVSSDREIFALTGAPFDRLLQAGGSLSAQDDPTPWAGADLGTADVQLWRLALAEWLNAAHFRHERHLAAEVVALNSSPGWGLVRSLHGIRLWLVPLGSKRDRLLQIAPAGLATWKQEGFRSMVRKGSRLLRWSAR